MLSHSVVADAKHMNAQARVFVPANCGCTFPGCETLLQAIQENGIEWSPYAQAVLVTSVPKPLAAYAIRAARLQRAWSA